MASFEPQKMIFVSVSILWFISFAGIGELPPRLEEEMQREFAVVCRGIGGDVSIDAVLDVSGSGSWDRRWRAAGWMITMPARVKISDSPLTSKREASA